MEAHDENSIPSNNQKVGHYLSKSIKQGPFILVCLIFILPCKKEYLQMEKRETTFLFSFFNQFP